MEKNYYQGCAGKIDPREIMDYDFSKSLYLAEVKFDGIYIQLEFDKKGKLTMYSRNMKVKDNEQLESLRLHLEKNLILKDSIIVGELAFSTQSGTEYQKKYGHSKADVFDILRHEGKELNELSVLARKEILSCVIKNSSVSNEYLVESEYVLSSDTSDFNVHVQAWMDEEVKKGNEGLIIKDVHDKGYKHGSKSKLWYKIKKLVDMDYVIIGYEDSDSDKYKPKGWIKNILCGLYVGDKLIEKVRVGSMNEDIRKEISENKKKYINTVVEVHGFEIFKSGSMRHPSFSRFRDDKNKEDCQWEK